MYKELDYQGKKLPIRVSFYALEKLQEETGKSGLKGLEFKDWRILFKHSLEYGHKKASTPFNYTDEEIMDMIDELYIPFMRLVPEFFKGFEEDEDKDKKKGKQDKGQTSK